MSDEDIDTSDIPPLTEEFFKGAKLRLPRATEPTVAATVNVEVEPDVLAWYEAQGEARSRSLSAALRIYARAHQ